MPKPNASSYNRPKPLPDKLPHIKANPKLAPPPKKEWEEGLKYEYMENKMPKNYEKWRHVRRKMS